MTPKKAVVAGHICLDLTPDLSRIPQGTFKKLLEPGRMIHSGTVTLSGGGLVSNTGLALHQLGIPVHLIGKMGQDVFGGIIQKLFEEASPQLSSGLISDPSTPTGYTMILNPPGFDRTFIHNPGANNWFYASDLPREALRSADLLHFGYPTLMRSIYRNDGAELVSIMRRARKEGLTTSVDFSLPDATSPAGHADWPEILTNALPFVDLFMPSAEELFFMLDKNTFETLNKKDNADFLLSVTPEELHQLSSRVLSFGVKIVLIKLGHRGIYLRTAKPAAWKRAGRALANLSTAWADQEMWMPAYSANVKGTCGAGDAAIAGFLSSLLRDSDHETSLQMAAAAGAKSVEHLDAVSGLDSWETLQAHIKKGWTTYPLDLSESGWIKDQNHDIWQPPKHRY